VPGRDIDNVDAAAKLEGLTDEQRDELSDRIHEEKRSGDRRDISMRAIREMAREIKREWEGRGDEIEAKAEDRERTQTRGEKHKREDSVSREKEKEGRREAEQQRRADDDDSGT
jgi:hypothetical protein